MLDDVDARGRPSVVTMDDVAARAGVSRALVSIVFRDAPGASPATRQRVLQAATELGYRPDRRARLLGSNRSRTVGVVFGLRQEFHGELVEQLYRAAEGSGYELALSPCAPTRGQWLAVASLLDFRCEALILVGSQLSVASLRSLSGSVPVVMVARAVTGVAVDSVRTDDAAGARSAVGHLLALGHRWIAHVDGGRAPGAAQRRSGYRAAMRAAGLGAHVQIVTGGLTEADGERAASRLLRDVDPRPTAVAAFNDRCAVGLTAGLRAAGLRVPHDVSVTGFDDSRVAALPSVDLTTIAQNAPELARIALSRAVSRADGDDGAPARAVVPPHLVIRGTTVEPPNPERRKG